MSPSDADTEGDKAQNFSSIAEYKCGGRVEGAVCERSVRHRNIGGKLLLRFLQKVKVFYFLH